MRTPVQALAVALETLRASPLRTLLSTLGVVIGVASLVAILALGDGLERYSREQIRRSTDLQTIQVTPRTTEVRDGVRVVREGAPVLAPEDLAELERELGETATATLLLTASARVRFPGDTTRRAVLLRGVRGSLAGLLPDGLEAGRLLASSWGPEAPGEAVIQWPSVGDGHPEAAVGDVVVVDGVVHRVVGVAAGKGGEAVRLFVPLGAALRERLETPDHPVSLVVRAARVEDVASVRATVESWLTARYGGTGLFEVASYRARAAQAREAMLAFRLIMGSIAGISLLVGGIGIMNILLASVFERTREIGVRRAAGARQRDIGLQFLAESVAITGLGSVLGVVLGLSGAFAITAGVRSFTGAPVYAAFTWATVAVAAVAALVVGLVFGTYPARRAARLSPIEAIRHE